MAEFEDYSKDLMEVAKSFLEEGKAATEDFREQAFLRSSLFHGFCFLEAHLNFVSEHFVGRPDMPIHAVGLLAEKAVNLEKGEFRLSNTIKYSRVEDRIDFLLAFFGGEPVTGTSFPWRSQVSAIIKIRNDLTHPKSAQKLLHAQVEVGLKSILECVSDIYKARFGSPLPYANYGLLKRRELLN